MKQVNLPMPTGWKLYLQELYRRVHRQLTSPWTKLTVLVVLTLLVTRQELSFTFSINGDQWLTVRETSVFTEGAAPVATAGVLASYRPAKRNWTAKQLQQLAYVERYADIALREMAKHGIPASITLAQGLLESGTGQSTLARKNNNHFGIKCFSKKCAKGHCSNHSDDHHKDFFRTFGSPAESYEAHSQVLLKSRYRGLFELPITDYKRWARGLREAGYATDPRYADKLIRMVEDLELHRYDR